MKQRLLLFFLMILCVGFGFSQEKGKFGILFKSSSSYYVGLKFNLSDKITLRPTLGFSSDKIEKESPQGPDSVVELDSKQYKVGLGLFYYFLKKNQFSAYIGPELGYFHQTQTDFDRYDANIIFGLQYNLNKHLAVFGEVGFGYSKSKSAARQKEQTSWGVSQSGFGIILYL